MAVAGGGAGGAARRGAGRVGGARWRQHRVLPSAAGQAESFNSLLAEAEGEHVLPLGTGALLRPHALLELAMTLDRHPAAEAIYTDEDTMDAAGRPERPAFKPAWSPDCSPPATISANSRCCGPRRFAGSRLAARSGPAPRHNLLLRLTGTVAPDTIVHLAKVLVHGSGDEEPALPRPHAPEARVGIRAAVSLIIPTRDNAELLSACIRSIRKRTRYPDYEILIIDNGSVKESTKRLFSELAADPAVRILPGRCPLISPASTIPRRMRRPAQSWRWSTTTPRQPTRTGSRNGGARRTAGDRLRRCAAALSGWAVAAWRASCWVCAASPVMRTVLLRRPSPGYLDRLRIGAECQRRHGGLLGDPQRVFEQVGGFDESLTVAFNDVDFCLKVHAAGYRNVWTPFAS